MRKSVQIIVLLLLIGEFVLAQADLIVVPNSLVVSPTSLNNYHVLLTKNYN